MAKTIVLLRAVNVGGRNRLPMADLRKTLEGAGMRDVQTLLQSGNVVLESPKVPSTEDYLETIIASLISTTVITRTGKEWQSVIKDNPFRAEADSDPDKLVVMFLKEQPDKKFFHDGPEKMVVAGKHIYIYYPNGIGQSKFTGNIIERALKTQGTARNWNTILKLNEMI